MSVCVLQNFEKTKFYGLIFSFLSRYKLVLSFKILSRTGKTDDFSSLALIQNIPVRDDLLVWDP